MSDRYDRFGEPKRRRNPARFLAPLFLLAAIAGTYVVVHDGIDKINHSKTATTTGTTTTGTTTRPARPTRSQRKYAKTKFYTVQAGDSLSLISSKTGVSVGKLEALNPRINSNALQLGQRIRLRR